MNSDNLSHLTATEIDTLPFGFVGLGRDGTVRRYNRYEADLSRRDPREVLGKNFFTEVAPCTQVKEFQGRFESFVRDEGGESSLSFDFEFAFRHGAQKVRIQFVRTPLDREVIMTVNRTRELSVPSWGDIERNPVEGRLSDSSGQPLAVVGSDFWSSLEDLFGEFPPQDRQRQLHRLGWMWGNRHIRRLESWVQKEEGKTLRESELQVALEALSESLRTLGLGHFDIGLDRRDQGLLEVKHHQSPWPVWHGERDHVSCSLMAGLHAGFLSYLSGRSLAATEVSCGRNEGESCRFVVGTEARLERLGTSDGSQLGASSDSDTARSLEESHVRA